MNTIYQQLDTYVILIGIEIWSLGNVFPIISIEQVETASSCHQQNSVETRSMNMTFQSGAMGHPINAQKMEMHRPGFPVGTVSPIIKRDVMKLGKLLKISNILLQNLKRKKILLLVSPKLLGLFGNQKKFLLKYKQIIV